MIEAARFWSEPDERAKNKRQDQKPIFNVIPPIPVGSENWNRCQGSGDDNLTSLGTLNFSGRSVFSNGYSR